MRQAVRSMLLPLIVMLAPPDASAQSCQNLAITVETPPPAGALQVLRLDNGPGVECEIDLFGMGRGADNQQNVVPPRGYSEAYVQYTPPDVTLRRLSRELAIRGDIGLKRLTVYRQWFRGTADEREAWAELVLENNVDQQRRVQLWWRAPLSPGGSGFGRAPVKLVDLPYAPIEDGLCAKGSARACVRTWWQATSAGGAEVTFELGSGSVVQQVKLALPANHALPPALELGYLAAEQGSDLSGSLGLRHRVCQWEDGQGIGGAPASACTPPVAWSLLSADKYAPPNAIVTVRAQLANPLPYAIGQLKLAVNIEPGRFVGGQGQGWSCLLSSEFGGFSQPVCSRSASPSGAQPELLLQFRAGASGGFSTSALLRYGHFNLIGSERVSVPAPSPP